MDRGAWLAIVHGVTKSCTQLKKFSTRVCVCVCVCVFFFTFFSIIVYDIEYSSLQYTVCPSWLSILYIVMRIY